MNYDIREIVFGSYHGYGMPFLYGLNHGSLLITLVFFLPFLIIIFV